MKKEIILLFIVVIGVCLICGCVNQSQSSSQKSVVIPTPTLKTHYVLNEPATDGNLRITVVNVGGRIKQDLLQGTSIKICQPVLKLENLNSGKTVQLLASDFQLLDENNNIISSYITFGGGESKYNLAPNQREQEVLEVYNYDYSSEKAKGRSPILKFDFSVSSGKRIVYFIL